MLSLDSPYPYSLLLNFKLLYQALLLYYYNFYIFIELFNLSCVVNSIPL